MSFKGVYNNLNNKTGLLRLEHCAFGADEKLNQ